MDTTRPEGQLQTAHSERRFDVRLLKLIFQKRLRLFLIVMPILFLMCLGYGLLLSPQTFSASTSVAIQQPVQVASAVSLLTGGASGASRYLGVLRSRSLAEQVEQIVHTQSFLGTKNLEETIEELQKMVRVEDFPIEGILVLQVEVKGPARLASDPGGKREAIRHLSAYIANAYIQVFKRYLRDTDTDREAVLYREAKKRLNEADGEYRSAVGVYIAAAKGKKNANGDVTLLVPSGTSSVSSMGSSTGTGGETSRGAGELTAAAELQALFLKRGALEQRIKSAEVTQTETNARLNKSGGNLTDLPAEDPLLPQARTDVEDAQIRLDNLLLTYADNSPKVVAARRTLVAAQKRLGEQSKAIQSENTSEAIRLRASKAELAVVISQIENASKRFVKGREITTNLEVLRTDMQISLEKLKTTTTEFARLSLQTVSGQSRMTVVDKAIEPRFGKPGIAVVTLLSLVAVGAIMGLWLALEYALSLMKLPDTIPGEAARV